MSLKNCCQTLGHSLTRSAVRRAPIMSGWHMRGERGVLVCLWIQSKKARVWGTRVHGEQRVIMLHPVASGCFTKPDTGGQGGGRKGGGWWVSKGTNGGDSDIMVLANTHTHTHACINTHHPCNWHVPQEGRNARRRGSSRELIRAWIHTQGSHTSLTSSLLPSCHCSQQFSQGETHTQQDGPPNNCSRLWQVYLSSAGRERQRGRRGSVCSLPLVHLSILTWRAKTQGLQLFIYSLPNYHSRD